MQEFYRVRVNPEMMENQTMQIAISIVEAAKRVSIGRSSIYKAIGRGELKPRKVGGRSLIIVAELKLGCRARQVLLRPIP